MRAREKGKKGRGNERENWCMRVYHIRQFQLIVYKGFCELEGA